MEEGMKDNRGIKASKFGLFFIATAVLIVAVVLAGCTPGTRLAQIITGSDVPEIEFVIPQYYEQYYEFSELGTTTSYLTPVSVEVSGFKLVDKLGQANVPGEGHIRYFLDVPPPSVSGGTMVPAEGSYGDTHETAYYWPDIGQGEHTFWAELVNNDHTSLDPPVVAKVSIIALNSTC